ncbi:hypothetical protein FA15DRAFT_314828 [Coprinopsis marcescibilis]|uniref:Uncharacterized protein n=1 Tax=Coprinopsis marcescibilis TaxID=230819 RepID=A0A5C3KCD5_COPMA|nr:hypothetical protein FA15DRAFT_314828 [Coprinopsis marcescibilis]
MASFDREYIGRLLAGSAYANFTVTLVGVGVQLFMTSYSLSNFFESPKEARRGKAPYIVASFVIFVLFTLSASLDVYALYDHLLSSSSGLEYMRGSAGIDQEWPRVLSVFAWTFGMLTGDGLLLYRCYILWAHAWWVVILPGLGYLATIAMGIAVAAQQPDHDPDQKFITAFVFLAVIFNLMVTFLICFRLLRARGSMLQVFDPEHVKVYTRIVAILIEAALPAAVFGVGYAITIQVPYERNTQGISSYHISNVIFAGFYFLFSTLSPQMIIFRVTTGRSWVNATDVSEGVRVSDPERAVGPVFAVGQTSTRWTQRTNAGEEGLEEGTMK